MRGLLLICLIVCYPALLPGQGFGKLKKSIVLERKLPAAVTLPGNFRSRTMLFFSFPKLTERNKVADD